MQRLTDIKRCELGLGNWKLIHFLLLLVSTRFEKTRFVNSFQTSRMLTDMAVS